MSEPDGTDQTGSEPNDEDDNDVPDRVDEQELDSFPASDPHSDWSGPSS